MDQTTSFALSFVRDFCSQYSSTLPSDGKVIKLLHVPHIAPLAYLHVVFPPVTDDMLKQAEEKLSRSFPEGISAFLRVTNGLSLFSTSLELYGIRFSVDRSLTADPQPFSILTANVHERPRRAKDSQFVFGSYGWDGSTLIFEETTGSVERWERGSEDTLNRWPSLKNMLEQEVARLSTQFSSDGILLHEDVPTTPPKMSRKIGSGANEFH